MDQKKSVPLDKLLQAVALGNVEGVVLSSVAARLSRLGKDISEADHARVVEASGGHSLQDLARGIVNALNAEANSEDQSPAQLDVTLRQAAQPFSNPALRELILKLKQTADLITDTVTSDKLVRAGFADGSDRAQALVQSFEAFIQQHKDEITALQILYNRPVRAPLKFEDIQALAEALHSPPHLIDESALWQAYAALQKGKEAGG
jgi:type I restriction enzyme R subunit